MRNGILQNIEDLIALRASFGLFTSKNRLFSLPDLAFPLRKRPGKSCG
jgi:hypothetical protein